jgi:microcin C transport system substrate-binding protein
MIGIVARLFSAVLVCCLVAPARAEEPPWRHAISRLGKVKYPAEFNAFDYVNPDAPKGGKLRLSAFGTFDSFNVIVESVKGQTPYLLSFFLYDSLMAGAGDEVATSYGLIAEAVRYPDDLSYVSFRLNARARWHDGKPITVEDVIFSMETWRKHSPTAAFLYKDVTKVEKTGEREVTFRFARAGIRELPYVVSGLSILPRHWWTGRDARGEPRKPEETTLEMPVGSGPYRIKSFEPGRHIIYERVTDVWSANLPVRRGHYNFDEIRVEYFRDETVQLEAFKADRIDFRFEDITRQWERGYDFSARHSGKVILEEFPEESSGYLQAFVLNLRRPKFQDMRVRQAFNLAFDFEEANRTMFFGKYKRSDSYLFGLELAAKGLPGPDELAVLEGYRGRIPEDTFSKAYVNPVNGNPEAVRRNLREAVRLLAEAGWVLRSGRLVNARTGEPFEVELLVEAESFERFMLIYKASLEKIGIAARVRKVDLTQYENRVRKRDFDIIIDQWGENLVPGAEMREYWGSEAADQAGSRNSAGIRNPVVDDLIERILTARSRAEEETLIRVLDRVLLHNHYVVPQWGYFFVRTARWDRFGRPAVLPKYAAPSFQTIWWFDPAKAAKLGGAP